MAKRRSVHDIPFHPLANVFPLMTGREFDDLCRDIERSGLQQLIVLHKSQVLDGRNRWRACLATDTKPKFKEYKGKDPLAFVISANLHRRHLSESQRSLIAARMATQKRGARTDLHLPQICGMSQTEAASHLNVSVRSLQHARKVLRHGSKQLIKDVQGGKLTVSKASAKVDQAVSRRAKVKAARRSAADGKDFGVKVGDCAVLSRSLKAASVDCVFTDPPWADMAAYSTLGRIAKRVLREHGSLLCYCGQYYLPEVIRRLSAHLDYIWTFAVEHTGGKNRFHPHGISIWWVPILWFGKGKPDALHEVSDLIKSSKIKRDHKWQQGTEECQYLLGRLVPPQSTILDPFVGAGTVGVAATRLNMRFVGYEIDEETALLARANIRTASGGRRSKKGSKR